MTWSTIFWLTDSRNDWGKVYGRRSRRASGQAGLDRWRGPSFLRPSGYGRLHRGCSECDRGASVFLYGRPPSGLAPDTRRPFVETKRRTQGFDFQVTGQTLLHIGGNRWGLPNDSLPTMEVGMSIWFLILIILLVLLLLGGFGFSRR